MTDTVDAEALVEQYRNLRDRKAEIAAKYKAKIDEVDGALEEVSAKLLEICNAHNIDSLRTTAGTAMRRVVTKYWTSDWERMYAFIKDHDAFHLLEQRIHSKHMGDFLEENPDEMPVGLNIDRKFTISVRKPTGK